jgi:hypothetical protein
MLWISGNNAVPEEWALGIHPRRILAEHFTVAVTPEGRPEALSGETPI